MIERLMSASRRSFLRGLLIAIFVVAVACSPAGTQVSASGGSAAAPGSAMVTETSEVGSLSGFCDRWTKAREEADAVLQAPMTGVAGSTPGRLNEFMAVSYKTMADLAPLAPAEIRADVVVLRDYYKSELDSGFKADTPPQVNSADGRVTAWGDSHC